MTLVCGVCGAGCRGEFRAPQPEIAPDLDMRPGEPARSTLPDWVQTCPGCGASAPDLAALPESSRAVVESAAYRALAESGSAETLPFRRYALIRHQAGDPATEAEALLQAAWAADDAAEAAEAAALRQEVAALWAATTDMELDMELGLRRLDVLRRAGAFAAAEDWANTLETRAPDEMARHIIGFQRRRIAARDTGRHLMSSALPPPAHRPHVSHGKQTARGKRSGTGFWARLLGR